MPLASEQQRAAIVQFREPVPPPSDIHFPRDGRILRLQKKMGERERESEQSEDEKDKPINKSEVTSKMT